MKTSTLLIIGVGTFLLTRRNQAANVVQQSGYLADYITRLNPVDLIPTAPSDGLLPLLTLTPDASSKSNRSDYNVTGA